MQLKRKKRPDPTPLGQWLMGYVREQDTTLTELSRQAGLSAGALRSLITYPDRIPSLETCLRLAETTGKPVVEILQLAGVDAPDDIDQYHPDRLNLMITYDRLPSQFRRALLDVAQAMSAVYQVNE
jgi:hypothetical protein